MMRTYLIPLIIFLVACSEPTTYQPVPGESVFQGVVALNTNVSAEESSANYLAEYQSTVSAGARGAQTAAPWASLNPTGTTYDLTPITNPYFGLSTLKTVGFQAIFLNIPIITIDKRSMPSDIAALSFDNPAVKTRFRALIDAIKSELNDRVWYISLGNEVDTYFSTHASEWPAYISLVEDARNYLHTFRADIEVGVTTTFEGATTTAASNVSLLNTNMDIVILTYYPVGSNFVPREPSTVKVDVAKMQNLAGGKKLIIQEWGYPSSTALGSSEQKQAEFYKNSFIEFKEYGSIAFPFISLFKFRDWSSSYCQTLTGQGPGQNFYEFMSSLGIKKNDGTAKQAYAIIEGELP